MNLDIIQKQVEYLGLVICSENDQLKQLLIYLYIRLF